MVMGGATYKISPRAPIALAGQGGFSTLSAPRHALAACVPLGTRKKPSIDLPRAPS